MALTLQDLHDAQNRTDAYGNPVNVLEMTGAGALNFNPDTGYMFDDGAGGYVFSSTLTNPMDNPYHKASGGGMNFNGLNLSEMNDAQLEAARNAYVTSMNNNPQSPQIKEMINQFNAGIDSFLGSNTTPAISNNLVTPNDSGGNDIVLGGANKNTDSGSSNDGIMADLSGVTSGIADVGTQVTGVSDQVTGVGNQVTGVGDQVTGVSGQVTGVGNQVTGVSDQVTAVAGGVTGLASTIGTPASGETVLGNQETLETGQSNIKTSMDEQFAQAGTDRTTNTKSIEQAIQDKFDLTDAQIQQLSADILSGQTTLSDALGKMSTSADTYYGGLAAGQTEMQDSLGGVQSDVTDFRTAYDESTAAQQKQQGQLMASVAGGFDQAQLSRQAIADRTANASAPTSSGGYASMYSDTAKSVTKGIGPTNDSQVQAQNKYLAALTAIKASANEMASSDPSNAMLPMLSQVATAFDVNGKLIAENASADGGMFARAIDDTGNLITSTFDPLGQRTNQTQINLNTLFAQYAQSGIMA